MPVSKAQQKAVAKYMKSNYDELKVRMDKGKKELIKAAANSAGESINGYVTKSVEERMERDSSGSASKMPTTENKEVKREGSDDE